MTPSMHMAALTASYAGHPDCDRIVLDLHRSYALGHEFGKDRAADVVDACNREGPYNAIGAAARIRALLVAVPGAPRTIEDQRAMIEAAETWQELAAKEREWQVTPLGKAFRKFESAHSRFWLMDGRDRTSDRMAANEAQETARRDFLLLLRGW